MIKRFLVAILLLSASLHAHAWGREGHQLVAQIADERLTPQARAQVHALLGDETLMSIASFADAYRMTHEETTRWHYVNIPSTDPGYLRERDCPANASDAQWRDCAVDRIPYFVARLKDTSLSQPERAFALKMLVHIVGDLHQPFHALGDQRGGNGFHVEFFNTTHCGEHYTCNLHGIWDDDMIAHRGITQEAHAKLLKEVIRHNHLEKSPQGNAELWANESHKFGQKFLVSDGAKIGDEYYTPAIAVIDQRIALAGIRLARVLNEALAASPTKAR